MHSFRSHTDTITMDANRTEVNHCSICLTMQRVLSLGRDVAPGFDMPHDRIVFTYDEVTRLSDCTKHVPMVDESLRWFEKNRMALLAAPVPYDEVSFKITGTSIDTKRALCCKASHRSGLCSWMSFLECRKDLEWVNLDMARS